MKIYAKTSSSNVLSDYAGRDVWVKVLRNDGYKYYVRILSIDSNKGTFTFNSIKCGVIDSFTPSNYTLAMLINTKHFGSMGEYSVCKPVEILTTAELAEIFEDKQ